MNFLHLHKPIMLFAFWAGAAVVAAQVPTSVNIAWLPISESERALSQSAIEKDAPAEAIFWRVHVMDEFTSSGAERALYHYKRIKVFTDKGKDKVSTIDIPFDKETSILSVNGRTIKADGTIVELKKDAVYERDLVRANGVRIKVKSFALPAIEPGAIVEYRWKEVQHNFRGSYLRLQFQTDTPVQKVTYFVKPLSSQYVTLRMSTIPFHCRPSAWNLEKDGFQSTSVENVPAFREEPMMPGEPNVRPWMLVYYSDGAKREPEKYWKEVGKSSYNELRAALKTTNEMKDAVATAAKDAKPGEEQITAVMRYLRANMREFWDRTVTDNERTKILKQMPKDRVRTSAEVFKSGIGTDDELNTLFAAMVSFLGMEARPALVSDRSDLSFDPSLAERYFLRNIDMAVKIGDQWKLYDVTARRLPPDMVLWREEGTQFLLSDPKSPSFAVSPFSPPDASTAKRTAKLTLGADGTIEGDAEESYTGHLAASRRSIFDADNEAKQQDLLKEMISKVHTQAEISGIQITNLKEAEKPFVLRYHLKIPGYAQRTGKRLFFQPVFFERGSAPLFQSTERRYDVQFRHAWKEADTVWLTMPEGYELDNADNPGDLEFGPPGSYHLRMGSKGNQFLCERELTFGRGGKLHYLKSTYPTLKKVFDEIHNRDKHAISLKLAASGAARP